MPDELAPSYGARRCPRRRAPRRHRRPAGATADASANRLAGPDRFATARVIAEATFPAGDRTVALLASGRAFADALSATYLSGVSGLPLLLTEPHGVPAGVIGTLTALGVDGVIVVGGTAAVSDDVLVHLASEGFDTSRLAGDDRYETARKIAEFLPQESVGTFGEGPAAIIATGSNFADALAAGPLSGTQGMPILLTEGGSLNDHARAALESLGIAQALIVGGTAAVSETVATQIEGMGIDVRRIAGTTRQSTAVALAEVARADRLATAVAVSANAFPDGGTPAAVLARADGFADALSGGPLAVHKGGPLLLTPRDALPAAVASELLRVLDDGATVYLLGGDAAIAPQVQAVVADLGFAVVRVAGADRFATAIAVAEEIGAPSQLFVARGDDPADALAAGTAAAAVGGAVLLTDGSTMPASVADYINAHDLPRVAVGGKASNADPGARRVVGSDRYQTAVKVAEAFFPNPAGVGIASGVTFPDALAATGLLGRSLQPLLLTAPGALSAPTREWLTSNASRLDTVTVFGGTAAVSETARSEVASTVT